VAAIPANAPVEVDTSRVVTIFMESVFIMFYRLYRIKQHHCTEALATTTATEAIHALPSDAPPALVHAPIPLFTHIKTTMIARRQDQDFGGASLCCLHEARSYCPMRFPTRCSDPQMI